MTLSLVVEHFDDLLSTSEDVEQVNTFILQLALQGKLVEQSVSDESGLELLQRIYAERTENGKSTQLSPIKESDKPFALPAGWAWARLGDIIQISSGKSLTKEQMNEAGKIPVYGGNGITGYHDEALVYQKTIVIGRVGFYCGSVHLTEDKAWVTDNAFITTYPEKYIHREYLIWLLRGTNLKENENATAQPVISGRKVYPIIVGIPPLLEQKRIAARLEELFAQTRALAKELARSQSELDGLNKSALSHLLASETPEDFNQHWDFIAEHFDLLFQSPEHVAPLRQSILELAVRGKLTQDTHDWKTESLEDISSDADYGTSQKCDYGASDTPVLRIPNVAGGKINLDNLKHATKPEELGKEKSLVPNDFLIVRTNGSKDLVGKGSVVMQEFDNATYFASYLIRYRLTNYGTWINIIWNSRLIRDQVEKIAATSAGQYNVNIKNLNSIQIPIPPLAEQERIVKRVERLLSLCDALEARLQSAEEERGRLVAAVMSTVGG